MTVSEAIAAVDAVKPNAFTNADKTRWVNEAEGKVALEVLLTPLDEVPVYAWPDDADGELLAPAPFDKLYPAYLAAMIDFANGEYDRYQATAGMFNSHFADFMRWYALNVRPADRGGPEVGGRS